MSMIVTLATAERVIAGCDSRRVEQDTATKARVALHDDANKLSVTGAFVLGQTGGTVPDVHAAWRTLPHPPTDSARQQLNRLVGALRLPPTRTAESVEMITVYKFVPGRPDAAGARVRFLPGVAVPQVLARMGAEQAPFASIAGYDELAMVFLGIKVRLTAALRRPLTEAHMVTLCCDAIREAGTFTDLIGGPLHVAVVDGAGGRWIQGGRT